jgi:glycerophosphoryl diester phosphodiesterase
MEEICPELQYMPVVSGTHPYHELLMKSSINYLGAEVIFTKDDAEVASPEFIEMMHKDNKLIWVNAIIYNYKEQLTDGHSDDTSICANPDDGWGWLARRGFDIIQTDWTGMMIDYLKEKGLYYR